MNSLRIRRKYLTMIELAERWGLQSDLDLRRLAMEGVLRVCVMRQDHLHPVTLDDGAVSVHRDADAVPVRGWLYPQFPIQVLPFDCLYEVVSDMALPVEGCALWGLAAPMTLSELMRDGVAMIEDVEEAEAFLRKDPDRDLSTREEKTRDRLITALAAEHLGWQPWEEGRDVELAPFLRAAEAYGLSVSRNAAKQHLRMAWERAKPAVL